MTIKNIPVGYKDSPLGIIPQEWEVKRLGELSEINPSKGEITSKFVTFLAMSDISEQGRVMNENIVSTDSIKSGFTPFKRNDIIVAKITPCFENGKGALLNNITEEYGFGSTEFHVIRCQQCNRFIYYHTISYPFRKRLESQMTGSAGQKRVPADSISSYKIPLPPLPEQEKIAEILSTWDKAIEKQTQLIQKLELRKKGLMQQLLTGKKRLPGFCKKWEEIELGEILSYEQPTPYLVQDVNYKNNHKIPVLTAGKTFILGYTDEENGICKNIPVILFDDFTTDSRYINFEFKIKSSATKLLRAKGQNNLYFIYCALQCFKYTIGGHERHWISKFQYLTISLPSIEEQTAIANILLSCDEEIRLAQDKLAAMKEQKKGLMQVLLTGKRRVKYGNRFF